MGAILVQGIRYIYYHYNNFNGVVLNYPTFDELFALIQPVLFFYGKGDNYLHASSTITIFQNSIKFSTNKVFTLDGIV